MTDSEDDRLSILLLIASVGVKVMKVDWETGLILVKLPEVRD